MHTPFWLDIIPLITRFSAAYLVVPIGLQHIGGKGKEIVGLLAKCP